MCLLVPAGVMLRAAGYGSATDGDRSIGRSSGASRSGFLLDFTAITKRGEFTASK